MRSLVLGRARRTDGALLAGRVRRIGRRACLLRLHPADHWLVRVELLCASDPRRQWTQWIQLIVAGITFVLLAVFLRETRGTVILSRKAARLRKETGDDRYQCRADAERASLVTLVKVSLTRPLWFLITEPVVMALTAWISLSWGVMCVRLRCPQLTAQVGPARGARSRHERRLRLRHRPARSLLLLARYRRCPRRRDQLCPGAYLPRQVSDQGPGGSALRVARLRAVATCRSLHLRREPGARSLDWAAGRHDSGASAGEEDRADSSRS